MELFCLFLEAMKFYFTQTLSLTRFRIGLCLAYVAFFTQVLWSQQKKAEPAWVTPETFDAAARPDNDKKTDGYFYLLLDEQIHVPEKTSFFHYARLILSEKGLSAVSQVEIIYDPSYQQVFVHYINVYRNGVKIDRTASANLRILDEEARRSEGILSGRKTVYCNLSDIRKGDIVEYAYSLKGEKNIFGRNYSERFYFSYNTPIAKIHRKLLVDKREIPSLKNNNFTQKPEVEPSGALLSYSWRVYNPAPLQQEANCPGWYDPYANVELSSFNSWTELKTWFCELFGQKKYSRFLLKETADSIRSRYPSSEADRITAAVDFVQREVRYSGNVNGIYSHMPHDPDYVLKNRYGDCKDKSLLLAELLRDLNVNAWPALVHTVYRSTVPSQLYSLYNFDHCITAIRYHDRLVFIDPTDRTQAGPFFKRQVGNYGKAMVLDTSGKEFADMPEPENKVWAEENFVILDNGDADLTATFRYKGLSAEEVRAVFAENALSDIQEGYLKEYENYTSKVEVLDSIKVTDLPDKNEFITIEHYLLKDFWSFAKNSTASQNFTPYYLNRRITYGDGNQRKDPLGLTHPVWIHQVLKIKKSGGWDISDKTFTSNNAYFYYNLSRSIKGEVMTLDYQYTSRKPVVESSDFLKYKAFTDEVSDNVVVNTQQKIVAEGGAGFNWTLLIVLVVTFAGAIVLCRQLSRINIKSNFESRYDSAGGWLVLIALGIILSPLMLTVQLIRTWSDQMNYDFYTLFFNKDSAVYDPLRGYFAISVNILNVLLVVFTCLLIHQFFRLRNTFRLYYILFKLFNLFLLIYDVGFTYIFFPNDYEAMGTEMKSEQGSILRIFIQSCIWIPYLLYSERSRHTFTRGPGYEQEEQEGADPLPDTQPLAVKPAGEDAQESAGGQKPPLE